MIGGFYRFWPMTTGRREKTVDRLEINSKDARRLLVVAQSAPTGREAGISPKSHYGLARPARCSLGAAQDSKASCRGTGLSEQPLG